MRRVVALITAALIAGGAAGVAAAATIRPAQTPGQVAAAVRVFVRGADYSAAESAALDAGLEILGRFETIDFVAAAGTPGQVHRVATDHRVLSVEPYREIELFLESSHKATRTNEAQAGVADLGVPPTLGRGVTIAINDSGVDGTHPMLRSRMARNLRYVAGRYVDVSDSDVANGHGTHVAGIAAGAPVQTLLGRKLVGAAPGARIVGLGSGAGLNILAALEGLDWVLANHRDPCGNGSCPRVRVVNNSWGSGGTYSPTAPVSVAVRRLVERGVAVVFAAGNAGGDGSTNTVSSEGQDPTPGVITVANYDDRENGNRDASLSNSSSRGKKGRPATYPDISAPGSRITSACRVTLPICFRGDEPDYGTIGGTSMAAPHVAGIVAQLLEANPTLTPGQAEDILEDTAHRFTAGGAYEPDPANDTTPTSFDKGHGLVDALSAVALARSLPGAAPAPEATAAATAPESPLQTALAPVPSDQPGTEPQPVAPRLPLPLEVPALPVLPAMRQEDLLARPANL